MEELVYLKETLSTQGALREQAAWQEGEKLPEVRGVYTFLQKEGRGQQGNAWFGGEDRNVAMTVGLDCADVPVEALFSLNMALSLGALDYVCSQVLQASLKWPNDLYVGKKKLGGILIENRVEDNKVLSVSFGVGWNVNQREFPEDLPNPVSLWQVDKKERDLHEEAEKMFTFLRNAYDLFGKLRREHGLPWAFAYYKRTYLHNLYAWNRWRMYRYQGQEIHARIVDVDLYGHLRLETALQGFLSVDIKQLQYGFDV
ncbi:hypothetical protein HDR62_06725 [bacterium]|nr:hypothetical protein [bacterium]